VALTEEWFSTKPAPGTMEHAIVHDVITPTGERLENQSKAFDSGDSVPPCKTCELIVPVLICPKEKDQCHS
jgi:hypothetical protein